LLWGIELRTTIPGPAGDLVGQWLSVGLIERGIVTQVGTQAAEVVRAEPALIVERESIDRFADALRATLAEHSTGVLSSVTGAIRRVVANKVSPSLGVR
jgi:4-aminobutyrate aminotransferase-like enzyme